MLGTFPYTGDSEQRLQAKKVLNTFIDYSLWKENCYLIQSSIIGPDLGLAMNVSRCMAPRVAQICCRKMESLGGWRKRVRDSHSLALELGSRFVSFMSACCTHLDSASKGHQSIMTLLTLLNLRDAHHELFRPPTPLPLPNSRPPYRGAEGGGAEQANPTQI